MSTQGAAPGGAPAPLNKRQSSTVPKRGPSLSKKKPPSENGSTGGRKSSSHSRSLSGAGERTVKNLRLSKALTIPDGTTVLDACRRMAYRRVDAALLTDSSALLCGIITDKDVATRVIAEGLKPEETAVSKVMTRNPEFVMRDTLAVEALQKMVQGKYRHLPIVENGEVVALLGITKCLYDAIARMERAAEKGNAIAAAVEGVERQFGNMLVAPSSFIETLREKMFRPSLGSIIPENSKVAVVSPSDSVYVATKMMRELRVNSVIVTTNNKPKGILTSKDVLMRVVSQNLPPDSTAVEKVMTPNPECATLDTTIVDALHTMHDGKFLHLPVTDRDGYVVACLDVLQITQAAVATVGNTGGGGDMANMMMQKFWDSAFALEPPEDDDDTQSDISTTRPSTDTFGADPAKYPSLGSGSLFCFKMEDRKGRVHRFNCGTESLAELISAIAQRVGDDMVSNQLSHILYEDDEGDRVLLATDDDLVAAVNHARLSGWKGLRLHLDYSHLEEHLSYPKGGKSIRSRSAAPYFEIREKENWGSTYTAVAAGAAVVVGLSFLVYLKRSNT